MYTVFSFSSPVTTFCGENTTPSGSFNRLESTFLSSSNKPSALDAIVVFCF